MAFKEYYIGTHGPFYVEDTDPAFANPGQVVIKSEVTDNLDLASIVDNLTTDDPSRVLSARQGKVLKEITDTKADKASPIFNGIPLAPTATIDNATMQIATTAFVISQISTTAPVMDGTASAGVSTRFSAADHKHPSDTSRAASGQTFYIGTTQVAINRTSAPLTLAGITLTTPSIGTAEMLYAGKRRWATPIANVASITIRRLITITTSATQYSGAGLSGRVYIQKDDNWNGSYNEHFFSLRITNGTVPYFNTSTSALTLVQVSTYVFELQFTQSANTAHYVDILSGNASSVTITGNFDSAPSAGTPIANTNASLVTTYYQNISAIAITGTSFNSITGLASVAPLANGVAAVGTSTTVARQDHVHPAQIPALVVVNTTSGNVVKDLAGLTRYRCVKSDGSVNTITFIDSSGKTFSQVFTLTLQFERVDLELVGTVWW